MSAIIAVLGLVAVAVPKIVSIEIEPRQGAPALLIRTEGPAPEATVRREDDVLAIATGLTADKELVLPSVLPPIESMWLEESSDGLTVRVRVRAEIRFTVQREQSTITVLFGPEPELALPTPPPPSPPPPITPADEDIRDLYRRILPASVTEPQEGPLQTAASAGTKGERAGLQLGPVTFRPAIMGLYMVAESALLDTPTPVSDQYYEVRPMLAGDLPLNEGRLSASYELRKRYGGSYEATRSMSHFADAAVELPVGVFLVAHGFAHFSKGMLETQEVDPGREYFFDLARFRRWSYGGGVRVESGGRLDLDGTWTVNSVEVGPESGFFDYQEQIAGGRLGYDVTGSMRALLGYQYYRIPRPVERPQAESVAHQVYLDVNGEILTRLRGEVEVGYRDERIPNAGPNGRQYRGATAVVQLSQQLGPATRLGLRGGRSTAPSSFEDDGFYVATFGELELILPLPLGLTGRGALGYHINQYQTDASEIGVPRRDRMYGWAVGVGRSIGQRGFARVDYRQDKRDSNVPGLSVNTHALTVEMGFGVFRSEQP